MTNSLPPDPQSSNRDPLGFDEFIGIFVAFTTIGAIFWFSLARSDQDGGWANLLPTLTSPTVPAEPSAASPPAPPSVSPVPERSVTAPIAPVAPIAPADPSVSPRTIVPPAPEPETDRPTAVVPLPLTIPAPTTERPAPVSPAPTQATPTQSPVSFTDITPDLWAYPFIAELVRRDIVSGFPDGTFRPNAPVTRAEYASMLQKAFQQKTQRQAINYKDVTPDFWATAAIQEATQTGFLQGYPGNIFRPTQQIPKVQTLVAIISGLGIQPPATPGPVLQTYQDAAQIPSYATEEVAAATQSGLVVNYPNVKTLNPNEKATRAEVAALIYQALVASGQAERIPSTYVVQP